MNININMNMNMNIIIRDSNIGNYNNPMHKQLHNMWSIEEEDNDSKT